MAGRSRKGGQRLLTLKHNKWWFKKAIPAACQAAMGGAQFYMENLQTSDLKVAQRLRDELDRQLIDAFLAIREGRKAVPMLTARELGIVHREALAELKSRDDVDDSILDAATTSIDDTLDGFRSQEERDAFADALMGREEVSTHLEAYLKVADMAPKTKAERRGNIGRFATWAGVQRPALTLDRINRKVAGRYVSEVLDEMHPQTQKKHLAALRGYWRWLAQRGHIEPPESVLRESGWPWDGQQVHRGGKRVERGSRDEERPFTADEVRKLLFAPLPQGVNKAHAVQIRDALSISLLSGMRLAEVLTLWVEEVRQAPDGAGLVFDIQQGKTEAAARPVPVHPDLVAVVERRLRTASNVPKAAKDWLFDELANERDAGDTFSKRFRRFRLAMGVDDVRDGKRRSLVNFHSARRWFATCADRAGQAEAVIKDVIGHVPDKKNVTRSSYIARSSVAQMRACVEAVRLPDPN